MTLIAILLSILFIIKLLFPKALYFPVVLIIVVNEITQVSCQANKEITFSFVRCQIYEELICSIFVTHGPDKLKSYLTLKSIWQFNGVLLKDSRTLSKTLQRITYYEVIFRICCVFYFSLVHYQLRFPVKHFIKAPTFCRKVVKFKALVMIANALRRDNAQ